MTDVVSTEEYACLYAAMILHDDRSEITSPKLNSLITAAGIKAKPIYCQIFADLLKNIDISSFIEKMTASSGPAMPAAAGGAAPAEEAPSKEEEKKKEEKKEASSDSELAFGLFD